MTLPTTLGHQHNGPTDTKPQDGYAIKSYGGIGNEHREYGEENRPKHNLSGSCHELSVFFGKQVHRVLIDVGAYQGPGKLERSITEISNGVDTVILTHPHMDHIGDFPRIFTSDTEFAGRVYATPGTRDSADVALTDAAKILAREYENKQFGYTEMLKDIAGALFDIKDRASGKKQVKRQGNGNRMTETGSEPNKKQVILNANSVLSKYGVDISKGAENYKDQMKQFAPEKPAYDLEDVVLSLSKIETQTINNGWNELIPGKLAFRFYNAGHIIGSVSVLFRITEDGKSRNVLFSGDLGSYKWDFHPTGLPIPPHNLPIDTVVIESTYGGKVRPDFALGLKDFQENLKHDLNKYKQIVLSTFAMDRTQIVLNMLIQMKIRGELVDIDILLDSPSGSKHTMNYLKHSRQIDPTISSKHAPIIHKALYDDFVIEEQRKLAEFTENIDPANGHYTILDKNNKTSLLATDRKKIIITASGMAEGGMVISHLEKNLGNPEVAFYFPGYLVPGTLGYALASESQSGGQQKNVKIAGKRYEVKTRIKQFNFLSGHADEEDLITWLLAMKLRKGSTIRIVHGDINGSSLALKHTLERSSKFKGINIIIPELNEVNNFPILSPVTGKNLTTKKPSPNLKK
ncbi:MBL fold metallo-hydrolase [Candidatus Gracilibacteria bacterium]|nr:MBL fold metallo-hydrolase [Candidatus Gracilibacteria bacterium]